MPKDPSSVLIQVADSIGARYTDMPTNRCFWHLSGHATRPGVVYRLASLRNLGGPVGPATVIKEVEHLEPVAVEVVQYQSTSL